MRVLIASGGTGGHFYPGFALARELVRRGHETLFLLRRGDPAGPRLDAAGLAWTELDLAGLPRRPSAAWLTLPGRLARSLRVARDVARAWRPSAAVGMGGYLTVPAALAARSRGVPVVLHESNAALGLANRLCAPFAAAVARGLPPEDGTGALTGTPLREELWERGDAAAARRELGLALEGPTALVVGGSQGAQALNRLAPAALAASARGVPGLQALHLAGPREAEAVRAAYAAGPVRAVVLPYLEGMGKAYAAADLALCRAGGSTVAELSAQRLPALLVPYPDATGAHQEANARALERAGAAEVLLEPGLDAAALGARIVAVLGDPARRAAMSEAFSRLALPAAKDSGRLLADLVESVAAP